MAFPTNPTNGQQANVNGVIYIYSNTIPAWTVLTNTGANVSANNVAATNNIAAITVSATGNIVTQGFVLGNGSQLTGVSTTSANINNGTSNVTVVSSGGNITASVDGTANVAVFATTGEYVTGLVSVSGNVTAGNLLTAGIMSSTGNAIHGNILTAGLISATGAVTAASVVGGVMTGTSTSVTGNVTGGNVLTGGLLSATGNVQAGNILTAGIMSSTGNAIHGNILTAGLISATGAVTAASVVGGVMTGTSTSVTGNVTGGNILVTSALSVAGNITSHAILETANITATAPPAPTNFDIFTSAVQYYTANATANVTLNFRGNATTTANTLLAVGQSTTVALLWTNGATAYYANVYQIDGSNVTPKWQGGTAITAGNANAIDVYAFTLIKTAANTYTVLGSQTKFA